MSEFDELMRQKAVALKYNPDKNGAPVIVASGMGYLAEKITETAMEAGIPVYEDDSLATLLTQLKLGAEIPKELYQAIVDIYIYFLGYVPGHDDNKTPETEDAPAGGGTEGEADALQAEELNAADRPNTGVGEPQARSGAAFPVRPGTQSAPAAGTNTARRTDLQNAPGGKGRGASGRPGSQNASEAASGNARGRSRARNASGRPRG